MPPLHEPDAQSEATEHGSPVLPEGATQVPYWQVSFAAQSESDAQPLLGGAAEHPPAVQTSPPPQSASLVQPPLGGATTTQPSGVQASPPPQSASLVQPETNWITQVPPAQREPGPHWASSTHPGAGGGALHPGGSATSQVPATHARSASHSPSLEHG